jgi:hypothetical protein
MLSTGPRLRSLLLAALGVLVLAPAAHAAAPGVNVNGVPNAQNVDEVIASGSKYARFFVLWSDVEPTRGAFDNLLLSSYSDQFARLNAAGVKPVLVVMGAPSWANGSSDRLVPPRSAADFGAFIGTFASRLRGKVAAYEIWNEPDETAFWHGGSPDVAKYAALLKAAYPAVKGADPSATVVTGPTTGNNYAWIDGLYNNGAKGSFDAVAHHPYGNAEDTHRCAAWNQMAGTPTSLRSLMVANGDSAKKIWATEFGAEADRIGEQAQADQLAAAMRIWLTYPWAGELMVYSYKQALEGFNLVRPDWSPRPAWYAFQSARKS